jgi:hypothetical protein
MAKVVRTYYETGELGSEYFEINGCELTNVNSNHENLSSTNFLGKINGLYKSYLKNGQLFVIKTYVDNILQWRIYIVSFRERTNIFYTSICEW